MPGRFASRFDSTFGKSWTDEREIYAVEYRLAPEWEAFTQLDEYSAVIDALGGAFGSERGVSPKHIFGGGDR